MKRSPLFVVASVFAVVGMGADLLLIYGGLYLLQTKFSPSELAESGFSAHALKLHGAVFLSLGVLPIVGLAAWLVIRFGPRRWRRCARYVAVVFCGLQVLGILGSFATVI